MSAPHHHPARKSSNPRSLLHAWMGVLVALAVVGCSASPGDGGADDPSTDARLTDLRLSSGGLEPAFSSAVTAYTSAQSESVSSVQVIPTTAESEATIRVNGTEVESGTPSGPVTLGDDTTITIEVTAADGTTTRTYTITVLRDDAAPASGDGLEAYINGANTGLLDMFGGSVALDGNTLVVGASFEGSSATGVNGDGANEDALFSGAAYVFVRNGGTWTQQAYLKASNTDEGDAFGVRVAISGDTVAIAATGEASGASGVDGSQDNDAVRADGVQSGLAGAVYVFTRANGTWTQQAYIKASNPNSGDAFGTSLCLDGDTLVVGSPGESSNAVGVDGDGSDNSLSSSGAAYVFTRTNQTWSQQAYLKASNPDMFDQFGVSVAVSGDTLAVGALNEGSAATGIDGDQSDNTFGPGSGAVYVFTRSGSTWAQAAYIKSSNNDTGIDGVRDAFGSSIALSADTLAVAATGEDSAATGIDGDQDDNSATRSGAVYVFARRAGQWSQQAYIKGGNTEANDLFGASVALDGDRLIVGATGEATQAAGLNATPEEGFEPSSGAAYVFRRVGDAWSQEAFVKSSNPQASAVFGTAVDISGDRVVIGAPGEDCDSQVINGDQTDCSGPNGQDSGAVYVY